MPASKRRRRTLLPIDILFFVAVSVTFPAIYWSALTLHEAMLSRSGGSGGSLLAGKSVLAGRSVLPGETVLDGKAVPAGKAASGGGFSGTESRYQGPAAQAKPQDETPPPTHLSTYSQVYPEKEIALLGDDVSNTGLEAVKQTDEWKSAANWDHDFVQINQMFKPKDLPLEPALPAFQVLPFEVPPVQMPAFPTLAQP